jgi:hypothetical protein
MERVREITGRVLGNGARIVLFPELPELALELRALAGVNPNEAIAEDLVALLAVNDGTTEMTDSISKRLSTLKDRLWEKYQARITKRWSDSIERGNLDLRERVHSILAPESGRFLNAVTTYYFNRVPDVAMVRLVRRRLLMRLVPLGTVPCASSGQVVDELGEHFIKCPRQGLGCGHHEVKVATQRVYGPIAKANRMRVVSEPALERYQRPGSVAAAGERKVKTRADLGFLDINERRTIFADVRTATIKTPETAEQIGSTVSLAEKAK